MKRTVLFFVGMFVLTFFCAAQSATEILEKSNEACLKIKNGEFKIAVKYKGASQDDTSLTNVTAYFSKQSTDTLFGSLFYYHIYRNEYEGKIYYNGEHLFSQWGLKEKKVSIDTNAKKIYNMVMTNLLNSTVTSYPFITPKLEAKKNAIYTINDSLTTNTTWVIEANIPDYEIWGMKITNFRYHWHIDKRTFYPILFEQWVKMDGNLQYDKHSINSYSFNNKKYDTQLNTFPWDNTFVLSHRTKDSVPPLLNKGTLIKDWAGLKLSGDSIYFSTKNNTSKLYLIDFWYMSCGPCIAAMPYIDSLSRKYKAQGLTVYGLNPYDYKKRETKAYNKFHKKHKVAYDMVFVDNDIPIKTFNVTGYPTFYLIDSSGKVLYSQSGFSIDAMRSIDKKISEYLANH